MKFADSVIVENICPFCGKFHAVEVSEGAFHAWIGSNISLINIMPELSATEREQLITHVCPECQDKMEKHFQKMQAFEEEEEEEEEGDDINACMWDSLNSTGQWW